MFFFSAARRQKKMWFGQRVLVQLPLKPAHLVVFNATYAFLFFQLLSVCVYVRKNENSV